MKKDEKTLRVLIIGFCWGDKKTYITLLLEKHLPVLLSMDKLP